MVEAVGRARPAAIRMALSTGRTTRPTTGFVLGAIMALFAAMSAVGITWGLPSRNIDKYLFGDGEVWSGEKIYRLAKADQKFSPTRGADVDVDPIRKGGNEPIPLTATEEDVARIYLRYRLYTYQPDEMITMMALAGMRPSKLDFDPRLYQYGGLFIYPVGALIKLCGLLGLIDVRSDVVFYLDHPDEFGKFYIVARAYSAVWGLLGVIVVYAITKRIASHRAGLLAALLYTLMPVVVCMAHEGKPHLPGAVLMLLAVYFAMRCAEPGNAKVEDRRSKIKKNATGTDVGSGQFPSWLRGFVATWLPVQSTIENRQSFWWMCICCGAALGMVLSSWPVFALIPLIAIRAANGSERTVLCLPRDRAIRMLTGTALAIAVYLVTNPYILINAFTNREVLKSNFGNSLAMYEIARVGEGFVRVVELTIEGATLPILAVGMFTLVVAVIRKNRAALPLVVVATVFFLQFVLIGAGKPVEYGRFGIFTNSALAIGASCVLAFRLKSRVVSSAARLTALVVILWMAVAGGGYLRGFELDARDRGTRRILADVFQTQLSSPTCRDATVGVLRDPSPYCLPPMNFARVNLLLVDRIDRLRGHRDECRYFVVPRDLQGLTLGRFLQPTRDPLARFRTNSPISWANKPLSLVHPDWPIGPSGLGD